MGDWLNSQTIKAVSQRVAKALVYLIAFVHAFSGSYPLIPHQYPSAVPVSLWPLSETVALAAVPWMINYQGRLTDASNKIITGSYTITFRLYDASTSGSKLWEEQQTITLAEADNGIFNVVLGSVTGLTSVDFNTPMWLSVQVADDSEMSPRQRITAVGYSLNADQLDSLDSTKFMRTDVDTSTSGKLTITRAGAAFLIKPTTDPDASTKLIDVQNAAGTSKFSVDLEGDTLVAGDLAVTGTMSGSTSTTGTSSASWIVGTATDATAADVSLLLGQTSGRESLIFDGDSTDDFILSDDLRLSDQADLRLVEGSAGGTNYTGFQAPATLAADVLYTLPGADGSANQVLTTNASGTLSWQTTTDISGTGDVTSIGNCSSGACFGGSSGTTMTSTTSEILDLSTDASLIYTRNDAGSVTFMGKDDDSTTNTIYDTTGAGAITIGSADVTSVTVTTDGTGTAEVVLPDGSIGSAEILDDSVVSADISADTIVAADIATDGVGADEIAAGAVGASELASTAVTAGSYGSATQVATLTVDADGRLTAASNTSISGSTGISGTTGTTFTVDDDNTGGSEPANGAGLVIEGGSGDASILWDATNNDLDINQDVVIDTATIAVNTPVGGLFVAEDPTASDTDGVLYLGKNSTVGESPETGGWEYIRWDDDYAIEGKGTGAFYFSDTISVEQQEIRGSSPAGISYGVGSGNKQSFIYDPTTGAFSYSGGQISQQFRNMVANGSFEAFSALETFKTSTATGGTGGAGTTFQGGWSSFAPDEWIWESGQIYQRAPGLFTPGTTVTSTSLKQDFFHGKSSVTLVDDKTTQTNGPYTSTTDAATSYGASITDAHMEQTITGLKPSTVYSVGAYMLTRKSDDSAAGAATTEAIVDITGEDVTTTTSLTTALGQYDTKEMTVAANGTNGFPDTGILLVESERISYTGKASNKFYQLLRGFESTAAVQHGTGTNNVKIAPFKHLTTNDNNSTTDPGAFTLYTAQFATTTTATDIKLHVICYSGMNDQCRFDAVQVVAGRSVPEFQPSAIVDTGDQTLYGSMRMGRTSDGRGGILSVDKALRTRAIEFFEKDPGMSGTTGGMGGVGTATKIVAAATSTTTLTTGGSFFGAHPWEVRVTVTTGGSAGKFKWEYKECTAFPCTAGTWVAGGSDLNFSNYLSLTSASNPLPGSMGIKVAFANESTSVLNDQWSFTVAGMHMGSQYDSFSGTATYQPGQTRIYKDPFSGKLIFQDSTTTVSLQDIVGSGISMPARVDWPLFFGASGGAGKMYLDTWDGYLFLSPSGASEVTFDVEICAEGSSPDRDQFRMRDNILNNSNVVVADWDIVCTQVPPAGQKYTPFDNNPSTEAFDGTLTDYKFKIKFGSPDGTYRDGVATSGSNSGDRWQFKGYKATSTTTVKIINGVNGISVTTPNPDTRDIAVKLNATGPGMIADVNGLSLLRTCGANSILKWNSGTSSWACAADETGSGSDAPASSPYVTIGNLTGLSAERSLTAGNGLTLTDGGANGSATLDVGAGTGISVTADAVGIDTAVVPQLGTANTFTGTTASPIKVKPSAAPAANTKLIDVQGTGAGTTVFSVDYEGDVIANSLDLAVGLADSELATISTGNKVSGSAVQLAASGGLEDSTGLRIAGAAAGAGLGGGSGSALSVTTDNSTVEINLDTLRVKPSGITATEIGTGAVGSDELAADAVTAAKILNGEIANADISATAAIVDTKLATISTANKVSGSAVQLGAGSGLDDSTGLRIATAAAGNGLGGGGGNALAVNVDGSTVEINLDSLRVKAAGITANELATSAVEGAEILDGTIANVDVSTTAAIAGTKVTPDFGSQEILTTGHLETPFFGAGRYQNLSLQAETFDNASWVKSANTTVTANAGAANPAPDGLTTADTIAFAAVAGTDTIKQVSATAAANTQFTASLWLKAASATTVRLGILDEAATPAGTYATLSVTTSWQRFSHTHTFGAATGNAVLILDENNVAGAVTAYAWGAQLESGVSTPSVYARTTSEARASAIGVQVGQDLHVSGNFEVEGVFTQHVSTGTQDVTGDLNVKGNTTLGDAATDTVTIKAGPITLENATAAADALEFGSGANLANLYRSANDTLKTDDIFIAGNGLTVSAGTVSLPDGQINASEIADGEIANADISATAAIVDTKLATISTANKVSGSAIQLGAGSGLDDSTGLRIATAAAGAGLGGGGGSALSVTTDNSTVEINLDTLRVKPAGITATEIGTGAVASDELAADAVTAAKILNGEIANADISATAAIVDTKLATISTAGKVSDSALSSNVVLKNAANTFTNDILVDTTGAADLATTGSGGALALNNTTATESLAIATDTTVADSDGVLKLGRDTSAYEYIWYDNDARNGAGEFVFSASTRTIGSSPAYLTFGEGADLYALKFDANPDTTVAGEPSVLQLIKVDRSTNPQTETKLFEFSTDGSLSTRDPSGTLRTLVDSAGTFKAKAKNIVQNSSFDVASGWNPVKWESFNGGYVALIGSPNTKFGTQAVRVLDNNTTQIRGMRQILPYFDQFKGGFMTLTVWARHSGASGTVPASIGFDDGVTAAADRCQELSGANAVTTSYKQFSYTFSFPATATKLNIYLYGAAGCEKAGAAANTNTNEIYYDGVTLAPGPLAIDYEPSPIFDTGSQVIYGNLAIGAHINPNSSGSDGAQLVFGEPSSGFATSGDGFGAWSGGSGTITYQQWGGNAMGQFFINRGIKIDTGGTSTFGSSLHLLGAPKTGGNQEALFQLGGGGIAGGSTNGVYMAINASSFTGDFLNFSNDGNTRLKVDANGAITTGGNGVDGQLVIYSEQGATDYTATVGPHSAMTQSYSLTLPTAIGTANQVLVISSVAGSNATLGWANGLTNSLTSANIFVGNSSNVATAVAMTGDVTISNTGVTSIGAGKVTSAMINDGAIVDADINTNAAIVDTKLAQIATAGKVSGAALTSLGSIPAGAGVIPAANTPLGATIESSEITDGEIVNLDVATNAAIAGTKISPAFQADVTVRKDDKIVMDSNGGSDSYLVYNNTKNYVSLYINGFEVARLKE